MNPAEASDAFRHHLIICAQILIYIIGLTWFLWVFNTLFLGKALDDHLGIRPRKLEGLWGIAFSPLLHADIDHLVGNTKAFLVMGGLVLLKGLEDFTVVTLTAAFVGGLGTWLFGRDNSIHIGASGVIFGCLGFSLLR
ncbi:MAG: rhomboid family intramembrane serine protease, partial [Kovacikia sp.]